MAGWVTFVCFSSSSLPPNMVSVIRKPRISLACSKRSRNFSLPSYNSFPIPENCDPCPGNTYAFIFYLVELAKIKKRKAFIPFSFSNQINRITLTSVAKQTQHEQKQIYKVEIKC